VFQITRRTDYAVRILLALGENRGGRLPAKRVAESMGIPRSFLHKIAADLVKANLVTTHPGPGGGLELAQPPEEITLLTILEAIEGPVCLNICLLRPRECPRDQICPAHDFWGWLQAMIVQELRSTTLKMLVAQARQLKGRPQLREVAHAYPGSHPAAGASK
jgi:Rrf2 family protein